MLLRYDMLDVVREMAVLLAEQAVFARVAGPLVDQVPRSGIHHTMGSTAGFAGP